MVYFSLQNDTQLMQGFVGESFDGFFKLTSNSCVEVLRCSSYVKVNIINFFKHLNIGFYNGLLKHFMVICSLPGQPILVRNQSH